jgi:D-xylose transport system permease protein
MPNDTAMARPPTSRISGLARVFEDAVGLDPRTLAMVGALGVIWIGFALLTDGIFLSPRNLYNLAVQSTVVGIMATGMVLVIVARHIDLSVGSVVGTTGMIIATLQVEVFPLGALWNWPLTIVAGLIVGALIGTWQGYWIAYRGVPSFVVTLAGLLMFRGMAWLVTEGRTVAPMDTYYQWLGGGIDGSIGEFWSWIGGGIAIMILAWVMSRSRASRKRYGFPVKPLTLEMTVFTVWSAVIVAFVMIMNAYDNPLTLVPRGIPIPVLILIVVVVLMTGVTSFTRFGRYVYAMGGNPEATQLAGINVKKTTLMLFALMGTLCAIAAVITTARLNAGANSMGLLSELSVISAAVIGGTSFAGGVGSIAGAILGAVVMQSLENGMVLMGVSSAMRQVIIGLVLIAAVWFDSATRGARR